MVGQRSSKIGYGCKLSSICCFCTSAQPPRLLQQLAYSLRASKTGRQRNMIGLDHVADCAGSDPLKCRKWNCIAKMSMVLRQVYQRYILGLYWMASILRYKRCNGWHDSRRSYWDWLLVCSALWLGPLSGGSVPDYLNGEYPGGDLCRLLASNPLLSIN